LEEFNEVKESGATGININKTYRLLCLVAEANHRVSKQGNKFGAFTVEDYTAKTELMLWGDDYVRFQSYLQTGQALLICGNFKLRYNKAEYEFKVTSISLAENIKRMLTKQLQLEMDARVIKKETIDFFENNIKSYPGKAGFKVTVSEPKNNWKVNLVPIDNGFEMNSDMISFLEETPEIDIHVTSN
jgi:DNA polymerase-3 subunit alpha